MELKNTTVSALKRMSVNELLIKKAKATRIITLMELVEKLTWLTDTIVSVASGLAAQNDNALTIIIVATVIAFSISTLLAFVKADKTAELGLINDVMKIKEEQNNSSNRRP